MSRDILDLIDNAIAGAPGSDAMRWTPDAEQTTRTPLSDGLARLRAAHDELVAQGRVTLAAGGEASTSAALVEWAAAWDADVLVPSIGPADVARIFDVLVDLIR